MFEIDFLSIFIRADMFAKYVYVRTILIQRDIYFIFNYYVIFMYKIFIYKSTQYPNIGNSDS